jgi:hypothetical protein
MRIAGAGFRQRAGSCARWKFHEMECPGMPVCQPGAERRHMWHAQMLEVDHTRVELKKHFGIDDYRPF